MTSIGKLGSVEPGSVTAVSVAGQAVVLANVEGKLYAFSDKCTHLGCSLASGSLRGTNIVCPCHGSSFDVATGDVTHGPAQMPLKTFAVEVVGDDLQLIQAAPPPPAVQKAPRPPTPKTAAPAAAPPPGGGVLANVAFFSDLDRNTVESLEAFTFRRTFPTGEVIVEEGRTGNGLYIILSGRAEVVKDLETEKPQVIAVLGPGEPFGEMALLGEWPRSASVRTLEETECLGMDRWVFLAHLNSHPQLAIRMLQILAQRLADTAKRLG